VAWAAGCRSAEPKAGDDVDAAIRMSRVFCNGQPATADDLRALALLNYGHFTTLQVRGCRARGFGLHLQRLQQATRELFGSELDAGRVRGDVRRALREHDAADCTLRITVFARGFDPATDAARDAVDLLVAIAAPADPPAVAVRLRSFRYQRVAPHLKHVGTFPLFHHRRLAMQAGADDALFVDAAGCVSEGSVWNLGFWDGQGVTWPRAPALRGTGEQLLQAGLDVLGVAQARREVDLAGIAGFRGAFACNSRGAWPVAAIDGVDFAPAPELAGLLRQALDTQPLEPV
jgi:branched-subunit amino acid aminotransferase/4-amino-4-deoxychorismate lyase